MLSSRADRPTAYLWHTEGLAISGILTWLHHLRFVLQPELGVDVRLVDLRLEPYRSRQLPEPPGGFYDVRVTNVPELLAFLDRTRRDAHLLNYGYHCLAAVELMAPELVGRLRLAGLCHTDQDYYYANVRRFAAHLGAVVAVNDEIAARVAEQLPEVRDRVAVLALGVAAVPPPRPAAAPDVPLRLLYAGRIEQAQKRVGDLVELARVLGRRGSLARLSIVGDGRDRAGLERFAESTSGTIPIDFHPPRPPWEMDAVYRSHDVLVLTSEFEGVSVSLTEAMLHELVPVVTIGAAGHPALVPGENCLVAEVGAADALADHIGSLEHDEPRRTALARAARRDAIAYQGSLGHPERFTALVRTLASRLSARG